MGLYQEERERLVEVLKPLFKAGMVAGGHPHNTETDRLVVLRIDDELNRFEMHAVQNFQRLLLQAAPPKDGFWRGVGQSFVGSVAFGLIPGAIYLIYLGSQHDFWSRLFTK